MRILTLTADNLNFRLTISDDLIGPGVLSVWRDGVLQKDHQIRVWIDGTIEFGIMHLTKQAIALSDSCMYPYPPLSNVLVCGKFS
jgi:hypothetical protein